MSVKNKNMARSDHLPLYHKIYGLIKYLYGTVRNFPKEYKYSLGSEMIGLAWNCLDLVVEANSCPNTEKGGKISRLSCTHDKLKMRLRMSQEIKLISVGQFSHLEENYMLETGKMIGGWKNWAGGGGAINANYFYL